MTKKRQSFSKEFKLEAIRLLEQGDKPATQIAREIGIPRNRLYKWSDPLQAKGSAAAFPGHGRRSGSGARLAALERENERLREENRGGPIWSFVDGPVTANKTLGVHTAWGRTLKDVFQRYKALQGFDQRYQNGFDCQGLWIEVEVEHVRHAVNDE